MHVLLGLFAASCLPVAVRSFVLSSSGGFFASRVGYVEALHKDSPLQVSRCRALWGTIGEGEDLNEERLSDQWVLKDVVIGEIEEKLGAKVTKVMETTPGPGLHNRHFVYDTTEGKFFCKVSKTDDASHFAAEALGLEKILATNTLRAPKPISYGKLQLRSSYLLMEHKQLTPFGQSIPEVQAILGRATAEMHLCPQSVSLPEGGTGYGFPTSNLLGGTPQDNSWNDDFANFFVKQRLMPLYDRALSKFSHSYGTNNIDANAFVGMHREVFEAAAAVLQPVAHCPPALLHGDLWSGNYGAATKPGGERGDRVPVVFDPACWYGHAEFDLAIGGLFGGLGPSFYEAYHEVIPKEPDFEYRQKVYQLYHWLNHLAQYGAGFGRGGTLMEPQGYFERCVGIMKEMVKWGA